MELLEQIFSKINSGGAIMWLLILLSLVLWALISRYLFLLDKENPEGFYKEALDFVNMSKSKDKESVEAIIVERVSLNEKLIKSLIAVAPLMGLLGTVGGMIETFASLETMEMFKPGGGIADGISQALLTTQLGLIVAVPAMLFLKFVEKKKSIFLKFITEELNSKISSKVSLNEV